jgi:hypothetical protein
VIEFFLCKQAQFVLYMWDQFVGVECFLSTPSVLLFLGVFFVFFFFETKLRVLYVGSVCWCCWWCWVHSLFCVKKAQSACGIRIFGCFLKKLGEVFLMMMMMMMMTGFDADE